MSDEVNQRLVLAWAHIHDRFQRDESSAGEPRRHLAHAAQARPEFRTLFPFTSLSRLCFSRCSDYPYTLDCPCIGVGKEGEFVVQATCLPDNSARVLGEPTFDVELALQIVVDNLPPERSIWLGSDEGQ